LSIEFSPKSIEMAAYLSKARRLIWINHYASGSQRTRKHDWIPN
jgi:hypothetical protein